MNNTNFSSETTDNSWGVHRGPIPDEWVNLTDHDIESLNRTYRALSFEKRIEKLYEDYPFARILVTSSFAATSAFFLHIISRIRPRQVIHFIDTGFHFAETLRYKRYLNEYLSLTVVDLRAEDWKHEFTRQEKTYQADPDFCCSINKVEPLAKIRPDFDFWVSSIMSWQTPHRSELDIFEIRNGIVKFSPMIDVSRLERDSYIREHKLPAHPLVARGYASIGCSHCTLAGEDRSGRWLDTPKTECGLHL
ncbi:MAG: phosphoadenylyl-sulfate reductase [Proteobacteria bacterium]|nr:phosphoadenylyl-sulfate reductase [Pseudomonadota bacterium]